MSQDNPPASYAFRSRRVPGPAGAPSDAPERGDGVTTGPTGSLPRADRTGPQGRRDGATAAEDILPTIDIRALLRRIWRGKWIIAAAMLVAGLLAMIPISRMQPVYLASGRVLFNFDASSFVTLGQTMVNPGFGENTIQNQVEILRSTRLIERVVDALSLDQDPEFNPFLNSGRTAETDEAKAFERRLIVGNVSGRLGLIPIQGTRVIQIQFYSGNPQTAAAVVNTLAEQYIIDQLDAQLEATRSATAWLSDRVQELRDRVQTAEEAVVAARAQQSQDAGQGLEITQQQLASASANLNAARSETIAARATVERLSAALEEGQDLGTVPDFRASPIISGFRAEIADLTSQARLFSEGSRRLIEINRRLDELQGLMRDEAARILESARTDLDSKQERETLLVAEIRTLETKALEQSRSQVEVNQLEREAEASRILYENFLNRLKETSAQQDLQRADARVLTPAEPPLAPLAQAKQRTMLVALALGALIGIGIVFLLDKLNNTFRSPAQLEDLTGETVIGTIPAAGRRFRNAAVLRHFKDNPKSSLAESIRSLRTSILFSNIDNPPKVVMFTSSVPGEAKSSTSMLVAITSQQMGKSAVIVDCDLRLPMLAQLLGADDGRPGLLSVVEGTATLDEAIYHDPSSGLHVLMTKPSEPHSHVNAADFLASNRFRDLIAELRARYDLVILDAPPTLVVADSRIVTPLVDAVVYMVRWDKTPRDAVEEGLKELRYVGAPMAGMVMTLINEQRAARYAYEGYAYHKGRYRDYFDTDRTAPAQRARRSWLRRLWGRSAARPAASGGRPTG